MINTSYEKTRAEYIERISEMIAAIDDLWTLRQIVKLLINIRK